MIRIKYFSTSKSEKRGRLSHFLPHSCLKGTVVNRAVQFLHGGSHEITLTVPLR